MKHLTLLTLALVLALPLRGQMFDPVKFTAALQADGNQGELTFDATIDFGWHVYGVDFPDGGPTAATLTIETLTGAQLVGTLTPRGALHQGYDDMFDMQVSYFEGKGCFAQRVQFTGGDYLIQGYLTYGACSDQNCLPPTTVEFRFSGTAATPTTAVTEEVIALAQAPDATAAHDTLACTTDTATATTITPLMGCEDEYNPDQGESTLLYIFVMGLLGGFVALVTPCVWPIIPMTVSFFLKRAKDKRKGVRDAFTYGISIVAIYLVLGIAITLIFGASALNALATNAVFNILFFVLLLVFAASFFGAFELTLPSSWSTAVDNKAEATSGLVSIFLMAFTLTLVSFSCTGPIIGFLLVEVSTTGTLLAPAIGMLGFAIALALPFTLFALFPTWLKQLPRSGGWMNQVKVVLGFLELAFALKFLSVADMAYGWHLLDRETFLALWIVIFALLGCYLLGKIKFPHDDDNDTVSVPRFFLALASLAFAVYMIPGLWGAPLKAISAFAPPTTTQDFNLYSGDEVHADYTDFEAGMAAAKQSGKPVLLDFTGWGCVNCRQMEATVWTVPKVRKLMGEYILVSLYVDDKTPLATKEVVDDNGQQRTLRTVGDKWSHFQRTQFGANAQPFYVILDNEGYMLAQPYTYNEDARKFERFLLRALQ